MKKEIRVGDYLIIVEQDWKENAHQDGKLLWRKNPCVEIKIYKFVREEVLDVEVE